MDRPAPELPVDSHFVRVLLNGQFAISTEITPPVAGTPDRLLEMADPLRGWADAVNVTDGPRALVHMSSVAAAAILKGCGIDPIMQMTCRDRNRIALQSDLLGASALGIRNVLILSGDKPDRDQVPQPKSVYDVDSRDLIHMAAKMRDGEALASGREIVSPPSLFLGAADLPIDPPPDWMPTALRSKIDAGAQFVQTQLCFDIGVVRRYIARLKETGITNRTYILIGLGPLASARSARWMRENLFGVIVPDDIIARMEAAADPKAEGVKICVELLQELQEIDGVSGAHLMAPGAASSIPLAIEAFGRTRRAS